MNQNLFKPPQTLLFWLHCQTVLTEQLRILTGEADVRLKKNAHLRAGWWEQYVLNWPRHQAVYQREVEIYSGTMPCWYARSHFLETTLARHPDFFDHLKYHTLGELIFNNPLVTRQNLHYYPVTKQSLEFYWLGQVAENHTVLWVRQASFLLAGQDIFYITEIFFPEFVNQL